MKKMTSLFLSAIALFFSCNSSNTEAVSADEGLFANIKTTKGDIVIKLEYEKAPITVANFVSLAEGTNKFVKSEMKGKPFYNGLKFHRVINDFMIQGGCPNGRGDGDPGYKFKDEFTDLKHHRAGTLSMANSGPATNGSQFFITHKDTPWLDGKHTVFGYVTQGQDVVNAINQDDVIDKITIVRNGSKAKAFKADKIFNEYFEKEAEAKKKEAENLNKAKAEKLEAFKNLKSKVTKTKSGLEYVITEKGNGKKPDPNVDVYVAYSGYLENGELFDSSDEEISKAFGKYIPQKAAAGGYQPFPFKLANKTGLIPGFLEGLEMLNFGDKATLFIPSHLAYGERGAGGVIPPNANIIFEVQILESK